MDHIVQMTFSHWYGLRLLEAWDFRTYTAGWNQLKYKASTNWNCMGAFGKT